MIIVYHIDEKAGVQFANLFFERGFDNIFLLTGGTLYNRHRRIYKRT